MQLDFLKLYDQYYDDVYRYTYFKTGNRWDTDDLVSEIFKKAFEKQHTIQGHPKAWLIAVARNSITDYYRKKSNLPTSGEDVEALAYSYPFEEIFIAKEELTCLKTSLKDLSREELEIVNLRYFSDLKYQEISELLNKTIDSLKMKNSRMIKKLGALVKRCMEG